ncbi:hypothetical protein ACTJIJ_26430 [Niabella sp. 22666]|uniref:hypothetical protein n=1 Tax=Niabella sp. 22666 TaxID=3453954 RepID=UPI003F856481
MVKTYFLKNNGIGKGLFLFPDRAKSYTLTGVLFLGTHYQLSGETESLLSYK